VVILKRNGVQISNQNCGDSYKNKHHKNVPYLRLSVPAKKKKKKKKMNTLLAPLSGHFISKLQRSVRIGTYFATRENVPTGRPTFFLMRLGCPKLNGMGKNGAAVVQHTLMKLAGNVCKPCGEFLSSKTNIYQLQFC